MCAATRGSNNAGGNVRRIAFGCAFKAAVLLRSFANTTLDEFDEAEAFVPGGLEQLSRVTKRNETSEACAHRDRK